MSKQPSQGGSPERTLVYTLIHLHHAGYLPRWLEALRFLAGKQ
jgi:hypothetical protein